MEDGCGDELDSCAGRDISFAPLLLLLLRTTGFDFPAGVVEEDLIQTGTLRVKSDDRYAPFFQTLQDA